MSKVWLIILLSSIGTLLFCDPSAAVTAMVKGSHDAVNLAMELVALYAFWLGFFAILEKTGISNKLAKILRPVVRFLFPGVKDDTEKFITMNMSANILGLGNASTPMAIRAINSMDDDGGKASINMIMLVVISSTSLQLLPSTVIGMRASHGSANPSDFLIPCMIATIVSTFIGIACVKILWQFLKRKVGKTEKTEINGKPLPVKSVGKKKRARASEAAAK